MKDEIERDLERYLDRVEKKIEFMERNRCYGCILYRDELMSSLRRVRELKSMSKLDMYENVYERACELEERLKCLAVDYLVRLKMGKL